RAAMPVRGSRRTPVAATRSLIPDPLRARPDVSPVPCSLGLKAVATRPLSSVKARRPNDWVLEQKATGFAIGRGCRHCADGGASLSRACRGAPAGYCRWGRTSACDDRAALEIHECGGAQEIHAVVLKSRAISAPRCGYPPGPRVRRAQERA